MKSDNSAKNEKSLLKFSNLFHLASFFELRIYLSLILSKDMMVSFVLQIKTEQNFSL